MTESQRPFNSQDADVWADPDGFLREIRKQDPVHWSDIEQSWMLTSYGNCIEVLSQPETFTADGRAADGQAGEAIRLAAARAPFDHDLLLSNQPARRHVSVRRSISRFFGRRAVEDLRPLIRQRARYLAEKSPGNRIEFVSEIADPLVTSACAWVLGIEGTFADELISRAKLVMQAVQLSGTAHYDAARIAEIQAETAQLITQDLPAHISKNGVCSELLRARQAGELDDRELVALTVFIASVGIGPTTISMGSALLALLRNSESMELARNNVFARRNLLDETLRFSGPHRVLRRFAAVDTHIQGRTIRRGQQVQVVVAAANRDPDVFEHPSLFDLCRGARNHLGFGWGPHMCIGASLARVVSEEAFVALIDRFPHFACGDALELLDGDTAGVTKLEVIGGNEPIRRPVGRDLAIASIPAIDWNHACPCGSGLEFERCHGVLSSQQ